MVTRGHDITITSQRLGVAGGSLTTVNCGGGNRWREKGETATRSRGANSRRREHLRGYGNPMLALDWAERRRARPATSGASELGRRRRRAHGERRQWSGRRRLARVGYSSYCPSLRGGDGARRENGEMHYRAGGRSDERPTTRE